jgi:hypothetical protein
LTCSFVNALYSQRHLSPEEDAANNKAQMDRLIALEELKNSRGKPDGRAGYRALMKSILSAVPAPKENPQSGKDLERALMIEIVELSRTESYGY